MKPREYKQPYLIIDCETGGLSEYNNPITEIAMIAVDKLTFKELNRWETFVRPYADLKIEKQALQATGITMDMINSGKQLKNMVEMMIKFLESITPKFDKGNNYPIIIGHNPLFDIRFIVKAFEFVDKQLYDYVSSSHEDGEKPKGGMISYLDTCQLSREIWNDGGRFTLTHCCQRIGYNHIDSHRAMPDVIATLRLLEFIMKRMRMDVTTKKSVMKNPLGEEIKEQGITNFRKHFQF